MNGKKGFLVSLCEGGTDVETKQREKNTCHGLHSKSCASFSSLILMIKWMWNQYLHWSGTAVEDLLAEPK